MSNSNPIQSGGQNADARNAARDLAAQDRYSQNDDGTVTQYDASTNKYNTYNVDDPDLSIAQRLFGFATKVPTTASVLEKLLGGLIGDGQSTSPATDPSTYGYTGPVAKKGLFDFLDRIGKDKVSGKGTQETTDAATQEAYNTQKEIAEATKAATKEFEAKQKQKNLDKFNQRQKAQQDKEGGNGKDGPSGGCFVKGTMLQMADGSTKEITSIQLGEETKGGIVEAKLEFMPTRIYNYKGVEVSGSHLVMENNQFVKVEDSEVSILTDKIEPVYCFETSDNRIWIKDIEFGDYLTGSHNQWQPHINSMLKTINKELRDGKH
tara:strand:- start:294 stop:1256 length:963 start_codon:yes stop_codon:yes gene_type:complete